jgi:hypothetical protein
MEAHWTLRMAAAKREVWTGAQLRRLLRERAGLELSAASVSSLLTKTGWPLDREEIGLSEQRKYRSRTARQKLEIVLAGLKGDRSVRDVCREHGISEALY